MSEQTKPHILSGAEFSASDILQLLNLAGELKQQRQHGEMTQPLNGQYLALMFAKPSLRTRLSFRIAMEELGGRVIESVSTTAKQEEPEDQIRVLQGYCHAVMVRTHDDNYLQRMMQVSQIPIINGLTELYHPCQTLADLLTLLEIFNQLSGLTITYVGDGNNILHSLLLMAPQLGIRINYCCPPQYQPQAAIVTAANAKTTEPSIFAYDNLYDAVAHSDAVYTDVWTSMGCTTRDDAVFADLQVNEAVMAAANKNAVFMHCMPMQRGKEVSLTLPDSPCSVIFQQSENRLHVQKALLKVLLQ